MNKTACLPPLQERAKKNNLFIFFLEKGFLPDKQADAYFFGLQNHQNQLHKCILGGWKYHHSFTGTKTLT